MADAHPALSELNILMQDGKKVVFLRDEADRLVTAIRGKLAGFGPWPSWDASRRTATLTLPDEESGLFEPERLFVLREQYVYIAPEDETEPAKYASAGPIDRAWWTGTESIVQARQTSGKH